MTSAEFKTIRHQLGITQSKLGEMMGMPQQAIARIESGERQPTKIQAAFIKHLAESTPHR